MNTPEFFQWALAQNLAYRIVERLAGLSTVIEDRETKTIRITGNLLLECEGFSTRKSARCIFSIGSNWSAKIPEVTCLEPWLIKRLPEWHADTDGRLCFEFDLKWERELTAMVGQVTHGLAAEFAARWLLNSTRWLLARHLFAFRAGLTFWPKSWDFWAHGAEEAKRHLSHLEKSLSR